MITQEITNVANFTNLALRDAFSPNMCGGTTFNVDIPFLHESHWESLETMREKVPDVPFHMLLQGTNAVVNTNYPDSVFHKFCKQASTSGMYVSRVFISPNYIENLKLGIDAAGSAGGFVEGKLSYTGDISEPNKGKYYLAFSNMWTCTLTIFWEDSISTYCSYPSSLV